MVAVKLHRKDRKDNIVVKSLMTFMASRRTVGKAERKGGCKIAYKPFGGGG